MVSYWTDLCEYAITHIISTYSYVQKTTLSLVSLMKIIMKLLLFQPGETKNMAYASVLSFEYLFTYGSN